MKKILRFLRSMKFGMALLLMILACSFAGSVITQGSAEEYYTSTYPNWGNLLLLLGFDKIFSSWYFITLITLLCINLICCSILRLGATKNAFRSMPLSAAKAETEEVSVSKKEMETFVKSRRFKLLKTEDGEVWAKNRIGHYGSFIVHLALLFLFLCASATLFFSVTEDITVHVDETANLSDGTQFHLNSFRSADEDGSIDYVSQIAVRDAEGTVSSGEVSVNHPFSAAGHKFYQYNYGTDGQLVVTYDDKSETLCLTSEDIESFFSVDGENGMIYYGLYPDFTLDGEGKAEPITDTSGGYPNPIYEVNLIDGDETSSGLVQPGETLTAGGIYFAFGQPVDYSVIRVKTYPTGVLTFLYISFALLIIGLWLCFFQIPLYIKIDARGYAIRSTKSAADFRNSLKSLGKKGTTENHA